MSKPKIYSKCQAGCKWEVPHKSELEDTNSRLDKLTSVTHITATTGTAQGIPALFLDSDIINDHSFIEVFPANATSRDYIRSCLSMTYTPVITGTIINIFVTETSDDTNTLEYIVRTTYLESGSEIYIHI